MTVLSKLPTVELPPTEIVAATATRGGTDIVLVELVMRCKAVARVRCIVSKIPGPSRRPKFRNGGGHRFACDSLVGRHPKRNADDLENI